MSAAQKYKWLTRVRIDVMNQNGEPLSIHVRNAQHPNRDEWEVFVNGGLLADGRESATLPSFTEAVAYGAEEAVRAQEAEL